MRLKRYIPICLKVEQGVPNFVKTLLGVLFFILGPGLNPTAEAAVLISQPCNIKTGETLSFVHSGQFSGTGFQNTYALTNGAGIIQYVTNALPFSGVAAGDYLAYAVNYEMLTNNPDLSVGEDINALTGDCFDISAPLPYGVCDCNNTNGDLSFPNTGQNNTPGYDYLYVLVNGINEIISTSATPDFNGQADGVYNVFEINFDPAGTLTNTAPGNKLSEIAGTPYDISDAEGFVVCLAANSAPTVSTIPPGMTLEDEMATFCTSFSDPDPNNTFTANICGAPTNGQATAEIVGSTICVTYTPNSNYNGTDQLCLEVCDQDNLCSNTTLNLDVTPINDKPTANNDYTGADPGMTIMVDVQNNDTDVDGDPLITSIIGTTSLGGTISLVNDDSISYTAPSGVTTGTDVFSYKVCDTGIPEACDTAQVFVSIPNLPTSSLTTVLRCNTKTGNPVMLNISGQNTDPNYQTEYVLTNENGIILYQTSTLPFTNVAAGGYYAYAINYENTGTLPTITVNLNIAAIGGDCVAISDPLAYGVCDCNNTTGNLAFTNTGQNAAAGYTQVYLLTDSLNNILQTSTTSEFTALADGVYNVFSLNYETAAGITNATVGNNTNAITGTCFELSAPIGYAVCIDVNDLITLKLRVLLQGALLGGTDTLMRDDLRAQNLIPLTSPYVDTLNTNRFDHVVGGNEMTTSTVLAANAGTADAIVDWIFIELRDGLNSGDVIRTISALVQRDGDIVEAATGGPLALDNLPTSFYVSIKHRNHLGAMTVDPVLVNNNMATVDFTELSDADLFNLIGYDGLEMVTVNGKKALFAGNANLDNKVKYDGSANDRISLASEVLMDPGNNVLTLNFNNAVGYYFGDINMDGKAKYDGSLNDRILMQSTVLTYPLNMNLLNNYNLLIEQLPLSP